MKKSLGISLGYIAVVFVTMYISTRVMFHFENPTYEDFHLLQRISFFIGLFPVVYLVVALLKRLSRYPALLALVILILFAALINFLELFERYDTYVFSILLLVLESTLFMAHLVIALVMLIRKSWPTIVSVVMFVKLPLLLIGIGNLHNEIVFYIYTTQGTLDFYAKGMAVYNGLIVFLMALMLYVVYYNKEESL